MRGDHDPWSNSVSSWLYEQPEKTATKRSDAIPSVRAQIALHLETTDVLTMNCPLLSLAANMKLLSCIGDVCRTASRDKKVWVHKKSGGHKVLPSARPLLFCKPLATCRFRNLCDSREKGKNSLVRLRQPRVSQHPILAVDPTA